MVALLVDGTEQPATGAPPSRRSPSRRRGRAPSRCRSSRRPPSRSRSRRRATSRSAPPPNLPPDDGRGFFSDVQADLAGDVVLGNLEGTLADSGVARCAGREGCRPYRVPTSYATRLGDAGFTVVSLANDHAYDFGEPGLRQTVDALSAAGVGHTGRRGQVSVQPVGSVDVAIVGFAPTDWSASLTDIAAREAPRPHARPARPTSSSSPCTAAPRARAQHVARATSATSAEPRRRRPLRPRRRRRRRRPGRGPRPASPPRDGVVQGPADRLLAGDARAATRSCRAAARSRSAQSSA